MEYLLRLCQTQIPPHNVQLQQQLAEKVLDTAEKYGLDLSKPESLCVGLQNPLIEACQRGNIYIVKAFVDHGASLNFLDSEGRSPLYVAISGYRNGHNSIARMISWGADVNLHNYGRCPLLASFYSMNKETSKLLIQHGADVNNVILPSFCFVESVFSLNTNLVMMACGVRFHLESFDDLVSLGTEIIKAGLTPRTFFLSSRRFMVDGFTAKDMSNLWSFQHLCLMLGFKVDRHSLQETVEDLRNTVATQRSFQNVAFIGDRINKLCWTQAFLASPLPLTYLARIAIRGHLVKPSVSGGRHLNETIASLPVPNLIKDFLNLNRCSIQSIADYMF